MGAAAAVSRAFGALRVLVIAAVLGTTYLGNAFQGANSVSNILFELLAAGALSAVLVPTFVRHLDAGEASDTEVLAGELLGRATVFLAAVALVGVLASPWIADILTGAVSDPTVAAQQQELTTFLLWFFIPQVVLYGVGAVAMAVLNAQRSFVVPAVAPIGNTVVMVGFLLWFRAVAGPDPGLVLDLGEKLLLAAAGTLGVAAFVAVPLVAVRRSGFRLRPRLSRTHGGLRELLGLSRWAAAQHAVAALLLGAAIVAGGAVEGGVVAYQVGWFFFLAPYGVIAQPIQTTILPELTVEHAEGDDHAFLASLRWSLDSMTVLLLPMTALALALSVPAMSVLAFGQAGSEAGIDLLAAALASLAAGLLPYGAFFLLARSSYVHGDSRTPAVAAAVGAVAGVAAMAVGVVTTEGTALIVVLGLAHTLAYTLGCGVLVVAYRRRLGEWVLPPALLRSLPAAIVAGAIAWAGYDLLSPSGRLGDVLALALLCPLCLGVYYGLARLLGIEVTRRLPRRAAAG
jgi:putative peptidoglycan lipid II flippase